MSDVTRILGEIERGDPAAAEQLLPLVYNELRQLAAHKLAKEKPGQTLQATALVHDAYIRLVDVEKARHWDSRGHFFAAAAEAMRRILVENARRKKSLKRRGDLDRQVLEASEIAADSSPVEILGVGWLILHYGFDIGPLSFDTRKIVREPVSKLSSDTNESDSNDEGSPSVEAGRAGMTQQYHEETLPRDTRASTVDEEERREFQKRILKQRSARAQRTRKRTKLQPRPHRETRSATTRLTSRVWVPK